MELYFIEEKFMEILTYVILTILLILIATVSICLHRKKFNGRVKPYKRVILNVKNSFFSLISSFLAR